MKERHHKQEIETELIEYLSGALEFELKYLQPSQLRITKGEKVLDYYPQRGRAVWIDGRNKWFTIGNIEKFIDENFKD